MLLSNLPKTVGRYASKEAERTVSYSLLLPDTAQGHNPPSKSDTAAVWFSNRCA